MTLNHIHKFHPLNSPYLHSLLDNGDNFNNLRLTFDALDTYDTPSLLHAIPLWHMLSQWNPGYSGQLAGISHTRHHVSVIAVTAIGDWGQRRTPTSSTVTNFVWSLSCVKYPLQGHHLIPKHQYTALEPAYNSYAVHVNQIEHSNHKKDRGVTTTMTMTRSTGTPIFMTACLPSSDAWWQWLSIEELSLWCIFNRNDC